jgi:hypothetical protein
MKRRTNLTINPEVFRRAQQVMALKGFSDFSGFVEQLIRDEWELRIGSKLTPAELARQFQSAATTVADAADEAIDKAVAAETRKPVRKPKAGS